MVDGSPQTLFVRANYAVEVGGQAAVARARQGGAARCSLSLHTGLHAPLSMHVCPLAGLRLQTSDAERIGVDQVAKILPSGKASGSEQREWPCHGLDCHASHCYVYEYAVGAAAFACMYVCGTRGSA